MGSRLPSRHIALTAAAIYVLCLLAALFTELLSTLPGSGISIWLSTGLLLSAALVFPPRTWPWLGAASAAAELTGNIFIYHHEWGPALLFASGNVAAALTGAYCIRNLTRSKGYFRTVNETGIFIIFAAMVMPSISATVGSIALGWSYGNAPFAAWPRIFIGDATGALIAAPFGLFVLGKAGTPIAMTAARRLEAYLLIAIFLAMAVISLGGVVPFAYLMIAPSLWAALRFRARGAVVATSTLTLLTALATLATLSPFAGSTVYGGYNHLAMQLFLLSSAASALLVGAISEENRLGWQQLQLANSTLEQRVAERSASLAASEARSRILIREVDHRSRNLLAVVQGIVSMAKADNVPEFKAALARRIQALARTNRTIAASDWHGADLSQIVREELAPFEDAGSPRATLEGEEVVLDPDIAQSLTLVIHELVTNAVKYGALSIRSGHISIGWHVNQGDSSALHLLWQEEGGPAVQEPSHRGFGSKVMQAVAYDRPGGGVHFDWRQEGLTVRLVLPIRTQQVVDHPANNANHRQAKRA